VTIGKRRMLQCVGACWVWLCGAPAPAQVLAPAMGLAGPALSTEIAAQPLAQALTDFARQTSLQLVYVSSLAEGRHSRGAKAGLTAPAALAQLLAGTGLRYEFLNERTVRLAPDPQSGSSGAVRRAGPVDAVTSSTLAAATEEVVVTATKREERLRLLPLSASVLTAEQLDARGIKDVGDISAVTPGAEFDISTQFGPGQLTNLAIRGISAGKGDLTTGVYLDDTSLQTPYTSLSNAYPVAFDMARVEVLRGPQGVLFGRGAEGGAVRFITHPASTTASDQLVRSEVTITAGGGLGAEAGVAVGGPVVAGVVGARVSAWYRQDGGYVKRVNPFNGDTLDADANRTVGEAFRIALAYEPNANLSVTPAVSYQSMRLEDSPMFYVYLSDPGHASFNNGKLLRQPATDSFTVASVKVDGRLAAARLTAISSYFDRTATAIVDETNEAGVYVGGYGSPLGPEIPTSYNDANFESLAVHQTLLTQELRLASSDAAARLSWLGGIYYSHLRQNSVRDNFLVATPDLAAIANDDLVTQTELSIFGRAEWALTAHWKAGVGMRVGWQRDTIVARAGGFDNGGAVPYSSGVESASLPLMPQYTLAYHPDEDHFFYASAAKGFRGGGTNGDAGTACGNSVVPAGYGPDADWSFELGAKSRLFERRLQLDASVYDVQWRGVQELFYDACGNGFTVNDGGIASSGIDLAADAILSSRLHMTLALGFNNVHFTRTVTLSNGQVLADRGTSVGVPAVPAPWTGSLTLTYRWPLDGVASAYASAEDVVHSHNPGPFTEQDPKWIVYDPRIRADPAINLVNLHWGVSWSAVTLEASVRNLLNQHPALQVYADAPGSPLLYAYTLRPRTVGLSCAWRR